MFYGFAGKIFIKTVADPPLQDKYATFKNLLTETKPFMKTKYGIAETFLYSMVILAIVSVILVGYFWIMDEYERFK